MNKTKRQLRAEAVERLKSERLDHLSIERTILGSICPKYDGRVTPYLESCRDALIDLLTDDEPPEGDAVAVLREAAHNVEDYHDAGEALRRLTDTTNVYYALDALADMVERDYVRAEDYNDLALLRAQAERECDEWKAKAERSNGGVKRSNLGWLYQTNREFRLFALAFASVETDDDADEWLMAEHVDETYAENDMDASEGQQNPRSREADSNGHVSFEGAKVTCSESDTRKKLERDVREFAVVRWHDGFAHGYNPTLQGIAYEDVIGWLDRQAAITGRACGAHADKMRELNIEIRSNCDELQAKVDELTAENAVLKLKASEDFEPKCDVCDRTTLLTEIEGLQAELKAIRDGRDYWKRVASKVEHNNFEVAQKARDHWQRVASRHGGKIKQLEHELQQAQKYGEIWPRYEDGAFVEPFDKLEGFDNEGVQKFIYTTCMDGSWQLQDAEGHMLNVIPKSVDKRLRTVKRPPLRASDGMAWEVERIDHSGSHPVIDVNRNAAPMEVLTRALKPEWLTHEQPDSWERVATELFDVAARGEFDVGEEAMFHERIEKLAKAFDKGRGDYCGEFAWKHDASLIKEGA